MIADPPLNNTKRLKVLRSFNVLDSEPEQIYDDLTRMAADICETPICMVSLVEEDRQWFKSEVGLGICETSIEQSICAHVVAKDSFIEIEDTHLDPRTSDNSLCKGDEPIRFYAGAIVRTLDGWPLGTLCVLDYVPRKLDEFQHRSLITLAKYVGRHLELTRMLVNQSKNTKSRELMEPELRTLIEQKYQKLTPREKEILNLMVKGPEKSASKAIARKLEISHRTVEHHRANILEKMQADSIAVLVAIGLRSGVFP